MRILEVTGSHGAMKTVVWKTHLEYWPEHTAVARTQVLAWLKPTLEAFHLTESTLQRIQRALAEAVERRPSEDRLMIRLLTAELTSHQQAQSCGFFLIEKNNPADVAGAHTTIELYLFG